MFFNLSQPKAEYNVIRIIIGNQSVLGLMSVDYICSNDIPAWLFIYCLEEIDEILFISKYEANKEKRGRTIITAERLLRKGQDKIAIDYERERFAAVTNLKKFFDQKDLVSFHNLENKDRGCNYSSENTAENLANFPVRIREAFAAHGSVENFSSGVTNAGAIIEFDFSQMKYSYKIKITSGTTYAVHIVCSTVDFSERAFSSLLLCLNRLNEYYRELKFYFNSENCEVCIQDNLHSITSVDQFDENCILSELALLQEIMEQIDKNTDRIDDKTKR